MSYSKIIYNELSPSLSYNFYFIYYRSLRAYAQSQFNEQ